MHSTTLTLLPFALVASLTLAAPWPNPFAQAPPPPPVCPPPPEGCKFPDNYTPTFLGYTGDFTGVGFPYYLESFTQGRVCPGRLDDTVRRALQIPKVGNNAADYLKNGGDPRDVKDCPDSVYPILQGTTYVGNQQVFVTWDQANNVNPQGGTVTYCGVSSPQYDTIEYFEAGCVFPLPIPKA